MSRLKRRLRLDKETEIGDMGTSNTDNIFTAKRAPTRARLAVKIFQNGIFDMRPSAIHIHFKPYSVLENIWFGLILSDIPNVNKMEFIWTLFYMTISFEARKAIILKTILLVTPFLVEIASLKDFIHLSKKR